MKTIVLAASLVLAACSAVRAIPASPRPTAFILIGDCQGPAFVIAMDAAGHVAFAGGNATPSDADKALLIAARDHAKDADVRNVSIRIGNCQDIVRRMP